MVKAAYSLERLRAVSTMARALTITEMVTAMSVWTEQGMVDWNDGLSLAGRTEARRIQFGVSQEFLNC